MLDESTTSPAGPPSEIAAVSAEQGTNSGAFLNYYRCPVDGTKWADYWSCTCDDKCPTCGREIEPYKSLDL